MFACARFRINLINDKRHLISDCRVRYVARCWEGLSIMVDMPGNYKKSFSRKPCV